MANRYWRGGTGTWSTTTTNWSTTSGGLGGASAPTAADSVIFDQAGPYTVTLTGALTCLDITVSVGVVTFSSTGTLAVSGSMSLLAGTVWTASGTITFNATSTGKTISTNATSMPCGVTFNGVGGGWTLGSAFVKDATATNLTLTDGTLSLGSFSFTTGYTVQYNGGSITATAGTGTMKCATFNFNNAGGLSLPFGGYAGADLTCTTAFSHTSGNLAVTATTNLGYQSASINTCVYTYNPSVAGNITLSSSVVLTVGQFTVAASSAGTRVIAFGAGGTIDLAHSTAATVVLNIGSSITGLSYTGTGAYGFTSSMNFNGSAITRTFTSAPVGGNFPLAITGGSGVITFTASSYFSIMSFGTWSGTIAAGVTIYITASATLNGTGNFTNLTLSTNFNIPGNVTITGSTSTTLSGVTHNNVGYTLTLGSNLTLLGTGTFSLVAGTLLLNTYTLSCGVFSTSGSTARAITFGATNIVLTNSASLGTTILSMATADSFTWTGTTGNEGFQTAMSTGKTASFSFGNTSGGTASNAPNLTFTGTGTTGIPTITTASWFKKLDITGSTGVIPATTLNLTSLTLGSTASAYVNLSAAMKATGTLTLVGAPNVNLAMATLTIGTTATTTTLASAFYCTTCTFTSLNPDFTNVLALSTFPFTCTGTMNHAGGSITAGSAAGTITCSTFTLNNANGLSLPLFAGATLTCTTGFTHTSGNLAVTATTTFGTSCAYTHTAGNITLSNIVLTIGSYVVTIGTAGTRVIAFGTGAIDLAHPTAATTVLNISTSVTNISYTGTGSFTSTMSVTRTFQCSSSTVGPPLSILGGSSDITMGASNYFKSVSFVGTWSGSFATANNININGALTLNKQGFFGNLPVTTLNATNPCSISVSTAGVLTGSPSLYSINHNASVTMTLGSNVGTVNSTTLTLGTLDLAGYTLEVQTGSFSSSTSNTRAIAFGAGNIYLSGSGLSMAILDNFSWTGTGGFTMAATSIRTIAIGSTSGGTTSIAPNFSVTSGSFALTITGTLAIPSWFKTFNLTGSTCSAAGYINTQSLTLVSGTTVSSLNVEFTVSGTITTNTAQIGKLTMRTSAITATLGSASSVTTCDLSAGTIAFAGFAFICTTTFIYTGGTMTNTGTGSVTIGTFTLNYATGLSLPLSASSTFTCTTALTHTLGPLTLTANQSLGLTSAYAWNGTANNDSNITLNNFTLTVGSFTASDNAITRTCAFGTGAIDLAHTTASTTCLSMPGGTVRNFTGTGGFTSTMGVARTFAHVNTVITTNIPNLTLTSGSSTASFTAGTVLYNFAVGTFSGSVSGTIFIQNSVTLNSTGTFTSMTVTNAQVTAGFITVYGNGNTSALGVLTTTAAFTIKLGSNTLITTMNLTNGSLDLNGYTATIATFSSSNTNTRSIVFGTSNIVITTAITMSDLTGFSYTGTGGFVSDMSGIRTFTVGTSDTDLLLTSNQLLNLTIRSGASIPTITTNGYFNTLDFTGSSCTPAATTVRLKNLVLSTGGVFTGLTVYASGTGTIDGKGMSIGTFGIRSKDGTTTLASALTCTVMTYLNVGTLDLAGYTLTTLRVQVDTNSSGLGSTGLSFSAATYTTVGVRITSSTGTGVINVTAGGATTWFNGSGTGAISLVTGNNYIINLSNTSSAKTFTGDTNTATTCTFGILNIGGVANNVINYSANFADITANVYPVTLSFMAAQTTIVSAFSLAGANAAALVTINSTTAGSQFNLSKASGTVSTDYLSIKDCNATGGASWYAGTHSTNVSNNTGWVFTGPPAPSAGGYRFFIFFPH